jgi:uncharacterized damage-inducible protein DinB
MIEMDYLQDLPEFLIWANGRVLQMLRQTALDDGHRIFAHILAAERVWASRLMAEPMPCPVWPDWTLAECVPLMPENGARYRRILAARSFGEPVAYRNSRGEAFESSVARILLHVFAHGAYHRGQIGQDVRRAGGQLIDTDYILFPGDVGSLRKESGEKPLPQTWAPHS